MGNERYNQSWVVDCTTCECRGKLFVGSNSWEQGKEPRKLDKKAEHDAVEWWNRRAAMPDDLRADVLALLSELESYSVDAHLSTYGHELKKRISERLRGSELADELLGKYSGMENTDHGGAD
jgi:hypothetical protein